MKICIVGAGFAGLSTAKVFKSFGHSVVVYEKEADVGGVWSRSRRYPGLTTQNVRSTYAFSDFPYPSDYPEWPSGEQVQRYLEAYTVKFGFANDIVLNTTVVAAKLADDESGWSVTIRDSRNSDPAHESTVAFDYLVVCNGIFSQPALPSLPGAAEFVASGGRIAHTSEFADLADAAHKHVLVHRLRQIVLPTSRKRWPARRQA